MKKLKWYILNGKSINILEKIFLEFWTIFEEEKSKVKVKALTLRFWKIIEEKGEKILWKSNF